MIEAAAQVQMHRPVAPEDRARSDFYALLGRLFQAPPDAKLLGAIAIADDIPVGGDADLAHAWRGLIDAASVMDAEAVEDEYQNLFQGIGASEVSIYSAFHTGASSVDHPRIRLRADLHALQLAKPESLTEPDDHFCVLFEAMRVLSAGGAGRASAPLPEQKRFFETHLEPGVGKFFRAVEAAASANFYRKVAALGAAFIALEAESFRLG